jgi:hypothetical protein
MGKGGVMRRLLILFGLGLAAATVAVTSGSAVTVKAIAVVHVAVGGAAAEKPCPLDPTIICDTGSIAGVGKITQDFTLESFEEVDGCFQTTGTVVWTLIADPDSTFMTREVYIECTPGGSAEAPGSARSFGNPFQGEGTWTILSGSGTGVFTGISGSGTLTSRAGGDAYTIRYAGTVDIP